MGRRHRNRSSIGRPRDYIAEMILKSSRVEEQTNAEVRYLTRLVQNKVPVLVKLTNDEEIKGWIEYYDRTFIRVTRKNEPNVFIYKDQIKYIVEV
jgi:sRNA-binding regulator protein Hfq